MSKEWLWLGWGSEGFDVGKKIKGAFHGTLILLCE